MLWPHSLRAQVMGALALALLLAQGIGAALLYRAKPNIARNRSPMRWRSSW
jgi:hypothetical protein